MFSFFITVMIVLNTISLAADSYPQSIEKEKFLEYCNIFFTWLFFAEMMIKMVGLGPKGYLGCVYNKFDAFIVVISIVDFAVT